MSNFTYEQLRRDVGIVQITQCSIQENQQFNQMIKDGQNLPANIFATGFIDVNGNGTFYKTSNGHMPSEKEEQYVLMLICKDLRFIVTLIKVGLVLGVIAGVIFLFSLMF